MISPLVLALVATFAPAASPDDPATAFRRAEELCAADRFGEAEPFYRAALATYDRQLRRQTYDQLMRLYIRSGREDKAIQLSGPYRDWLRMVGDPSGEAEMDLLVADCRLRYGYPEVAEAHLAAALAATTPLPPQRRLEALRLRAECTALRRDPAEAGRWADLEAAATVVGREAMVINDFPGRVVAARFLSESKYRRGDRVGALAALDPLPEMHDRLADPDGRRDTQRQRAKLIAAGGGFPDAAPLFAEALSLHRKHHPGQRLIAGDILVEWATAATTSGRPADATRLHADAAIEFRAALDAPDSDGPLAAFVRLQQLSRSARQFRLALELSRTAGERWSGDPLVDARLAADRGGLELISAAYQTARTLLTRSLAETDATNPPNLRALPQVLVNLATAELACATPERADPLLTRCVGLYRTHRLPPDPVLAECEYLRGVSAARRGEFSPAIAFFRAGLRVAEQVGSTADPVRFNLWLNIALIHKEQGDPAAAGDALTEATGILARSADPDDLNSALIDAVRADLFVARGQIAPALALLPGIETACTRHGLRGGYVWTTARHVRGLGLLAARDVPAAEAVFAELAATHRREGHVLLARTLNALGVCAELQGHDSDAAAHFGEARTFQATRPGCPPVTRAITLWRLAVLADKAGRSVEAKALLGEVFDVADRARMNTFGEAAQRAQFFAQFAPAFELLARWAARDGDGDAVLRVVSRSRSRTLLDQTLAAGVDPRDRLTGEVRTVLLAREVAARAAVSRLRGQAMLLPSDSSGDPVARALIAKLDAAQKEYADTWQEIVNADPLTRVLTDPGFADASLARVRREIHAADGVLLVYMIGRDESYAVLATDPAAPAEVFRLAVTRGPTDGIADPPPAAAGDRVGFRGVALRRTAPQPDRPPPDRQTVPLTDATAGRLVEYYLRQIADPGFNPTRGISVVSRKTPGTMVATAPEALGDAVLPPALRNRIRATGAKRLVVIPDGPLHKLPIEALLVSGGPTPRYALDELPAVCYAPSPAVLAVVTGRPRAAGPASLLTAGNPAYPDDRLASAAPTRGSVSGGQLPRLPFTAIESRRIREFFPTNRITALEGETATEANVVAGIPGKRVIHLAAHGFADQSFGNLFAAVALTPPPPGQETPDNDGFLTLHEIHRLRLSGCELTVLSACVTNVGPQRPLEAGVTLAGAFLTAGSRGVLASCWSVDDRATAELMAAHFAAARLGGDTPASQADALKAARLAVRATPGWEAPFYWAPFVFLGPPD